MPAKITVDWDAVKADPVEFTKTLLTRPDGTKCIPHAAQEELMRGIARNTVIVTGRQFGKSTCMGWIVTWFACTHPNREVWIIGPTLDQSRIIYNEVQSYFRKAPLNSLLVGKPKEYPFPELKLKNGTVIHGRGANSSQYIRGNRAHFAVVDEAAFIKEGTLRTVIEPMFLVTGQEADSALVLISTPFGQGEFFEAAERAKTLNNERGRYFHFDSFSNPYADKQLLDEQKAFYGEDSVVWRTEYLGLFADSDLQVFPTADIKAAYEAWPEGARFPLGAQPDHRYTQGVDLANLRDYFVSTVFDITNPSACILARMDRYQKRGYTAYKRTIRTNYQAYNHARTLIDATTLAESVVEDLADINAEGYVFSGADAKWQVVQELARMLSEHRLILPYDRDLIAELTYFQYKITPSKNVRMEAARGHDDIVMSLALNAHLACLPRTLGLFTAVNTRPQPKHYARRSYESRLAAAIANDPFREEDNA